MAEWSMAVVLKTSPDRLDQGGYIFADRIHEDPQIVAITSEILPIPSEPRQPIRRFSPPSC
jgi:hypothetical protein